MFRNLAKKIFGSVNERTLHSMQHYVDDINALEEEYSKKSDDDLRIMTTALRDRVKGGESLEDVLVEAFALVREAGKRVLNLRLFDVQLLGGIVLHQGKIAEMKTGEGKTLVAVAPAFLNALEGKGVHIVTVNDYLAARDANWMGGVFRFLGLTVGCLLNEMGDEERKEAYACDVTYGTNSEFGFDYLRDNMKIDKEELCQRDFNYAIVDEVDSILIDEARTPLIISGHTDDNSKLYVDVNTVIKKIPDSLCNIDEKDRVVSLTEEGTEEVEKVFKNLGFVAPEDNLYDIKYMNLVHHINQALKAHKLFKNEVDYMVKDGVVYIVDEFTGRIMEGRRFSDGLHQALEAKEGVAIQNENQTLASITYQNYFRMYPKLAGMTGTAMTESIEFEHIYGLKTVEIPPNKKVARKDEDDVIYKTEAEKYKAIVNQIKECYERRQPVLVGTISIEKSEHLSRLLKAAKLPHYVLNAKYHEKEAFIIAQAGKPSAITIATNMAGRGTDIKLGGSIDQELQDIRANQSLTQEEKEKYIAAAEERLEADKQIAMEAGGLYIVGTERHESRRIDNQLRGRSGRQGDPGRSKFYLSLEDDLMRIFGSQKLSVMLTRLGLKDDEAIVHPWISKSLEKAQKKVENMHYEMRKNILKYDDVVNTQRKVIFEQRRDIMFANDVSPEIDYIREEKNAELVDRYIPHRSMVEDWQLGSLQKEVERIYGLILPLEELVRSDVDVDRDEILQRINSTTTALFKGQEEKYGADLVKQLQKRIFLLTIDRLWKNHLYALDKVRQGINLRAYAQKDPLLEYKKEAYDLFENLMYTINEETLMTIAKIKLNLNTMSDANGFFNMQQQQVWGIRDNRQELRETLGKLQQMQASNAAIAENHKPLVSRSSDGRKSNDRSTWGRVGRNDPCPCGSGKKYKQCCGKE